jgi:hypothetical protein
MTALAGVAHPSAVMVDPKNIAALPGQLFSAFQGSGCPLPHMLPATSASPSPPHIMATATTPAGWCRHAHRTIESSTNTYARGPRMCISSRLFPERLAVATSSGSCSQPQPVATKRAAFTTGTAEARNAAEGASLQKHTCAHKSQRLVSYIVNLWVCKFTAQFAAHARNLIH